ncbi:protein NPGR2 isoform X2 [Malania oleifera]|uniref:protein NPGR2 isoform X2 n=1 Tax=Malania oleifera TaxID=397392 RepID=UPI0025AE5310|nr:protein NPGR2 isoform X2 [Malania oleifera]XP_057964696.1 protein NPGR2 isoform X2 [Malania oleifera]
MKRSNKRIKEQRRRAIAKRLRKIMKCLCSGEQLRAASGDEMVPSSESLATKDFSVSGFSARAGERERRPDTGNIEEAESSLRESGSLNYEEARALLGRYEYQKGNIEAALHVFEGIDIAAVIPKMKFTLAKKGDRRKRRSQSDATPPMSIHAVSLLLEAIFLKAKSLQELGSFKEAAQSCKVILDIVESSLPDGLPENFGADCKLQETLSKAVELLPELWKLADSPSEAILSYRRALLHHWNLGVETTAKIQREFAIFLLYSGGEASPPNLRSQMDSSFVPRNNTEEAILLLMILLRKASLKRIEWDPSILDHLSFALSVSGDLRALSNQVEELLPGTMDRKERYHTLALCYYGEGEGLTALNLLRKLLSNRDNPNFLPALLLASKICGENPNLAAEGVDFSRRALDSSQSRCDQLVSVANCLLGIALSENSRSAVADSDRVATQSEALLALETAGRKTKLRDPTVVYHLSLENAEQRKLDAALYYAKLLLKLEGGSNVKGWLLLARVLSAQKRFLDAVTIINAALDQTGKWDQGELLRTKAKLQIAQGQLKSAVETYTQLVAVLQVQRKSFGSGKNLLKGSRSPNRSLELETWHDVAQIYISLLRWRDAEICLSKSKAINPLSASRCHATGKGLQKEALKAFVNALDIEPNHVPSLISTAVVLRRLGGSAAVVRNLLTDALRLDRMNASAWYNLGLLYSAEGAASSLEAAECFEAATLLEESAPVEPFR